MDYRTGKLKARIVCPVAGPPVHDGVVEFADGKIVAIHDRPRTDAVDLGDVAIVPGLVNAHTHLEFSNLRQPLGPPRPFAAWIRAVVAERRRRRTGGPSTTRDVEPDDGTTRELAIDWLQEQDPLARGLKECLSTGTSLIGDIATAWLSQADDPSAILGAVDEGGLVSFRELFSPVSGRNELLTVDEGLSYVQGMLQHAPRGRCGFSPHAPYSVTRHLVRWAVGTADRNVPRIGTRIRNPVRLPVAMHLAETREELELLAEGSGPLVEMLDRVGLWNRLAFRRGTRPMDTLRVLWFARRVLVIHGNYLEDDELRFLGRSPHMSLVYCPRTHAYFGHERYPLESSLRHGVRVALGTDSRASNPDLNLWEEAKAVATAFPAIDPMRILEMATRDGAEALGMGQQHGVLEVGRAANLCCIQLPPGNRGSADGLLAPQSRVCGAMLQGKWITQPETVAKA